MVRKFWQQTPLLILALALPIAAQTVTISPTSATVNLDATRQFTKSVTGNANTNVTWAVNGVTGGNTTVGTISTTGLYTPPATLPPNPATIKVRAISVANTTKFAEANVSLQHPTPTIATVDPTDLNIGNTTLIVKGTKYYTGATILLQNAAVTTEFISSTELRAAVSLPNAQQYCVIVQNPAPAAANSAQKCFTVRATITVTTSPTTATVRGGATRLFTATVRNTNTTGVEWMVNGVVGGSPTTGTIASDGTFTAPMNIAAVNGSVKVGARSVKNNASFGESTVTLQNPVPTISSVNPTVIPLGNANFTINGNGFAPGATVNVGGVAMTATVNSLTQISVSGTTKAAPGGIAAITVSNPAPGPTTSAPLIANISPANPKVSYLAAKRFLEQATWGASPTEIFRVMQLGFDDWLTEQKNLPSSDYSMPTPNGDIPVYDMQAEFFNNAMNAPDQLRKRVAFTLHKTMVVSAVDIEDTHYLVPHHRVLLRNAFGNLKTLLKEITLDVAMGEYLDMVNNDKADPTKGFEPNENYAREVMQLFSLGTTFLRADGSPLRDPNGVPYPSYTQNDVMELAHVFTGWTYPPGKGTGSNRHNNRNYGAPMVAVEANHDTRSKLILGRTIPAGQTAMMDVDSALQILFEHPNIVPFYSLRLIQSHVTSNPSAAYLMRVNAAFNNNGQGVRGDLFAVMRAVLLDPEARAGDNPATPNPFSVKGLEGTIVLDNPIEADLERMGQKLFYPGSVFSYFSPLTRAPGNPGLYGPEYQGFTPVTALERINYIDYLLKLDANAEAKPNLAPYIALAGDVESLIAAINAHFLNGTMPDLLKQGIRDTLATTTDPTRRARLALYLALSSAHYQIQN
ncbi:MAG: DUF1800 family protein [Acidobacteria bacterium]|nr:DUF1800 family protein [Acidobacteriota bacterium]